MPAYYVGPCKILGREISGHAHFIRRTPLTVFAVCKTNAIDDVYLLSSTQNTRRSVMYRDYYCVSLALGPLVQSCRCMTGVKT